MDKRTVLRDAVSALKGMQAAVLDDRPALAAGIESVIDNLCSVEHELYLDEIDVPEQPSGPSTGAPDDTPPEPLATALEDDTEVREEVTTLNPYMTYSTEVAENDYLIFKDGELHRTYKILDEREEYVDECNRIGIVPLFSSGISGSPTIDATSEVTEEEAKAAGDAAIEDEASVHAGRILPDGTYEKNIELGGHGRK